MTRTALIFALSLPLTACSTDPSLLSLQPDLDSEAQAITVQAVDWEYGTPIAGAHVCPLMEVGSACAITGPDGMAELTVQAAALGGSDDTDLILVQVEADGYLAALHARPGSDGDGRWPMMVMSEASFEQQMASAGVEPDMDRTFVMVRAYGPGAGGRRLAVAPPMGEVLYAAKAGDLLRAAEATSETGIAMVANANSGVVEVGLEGRGMAGCTRLSGWDVAPDAADAYTLSGHARTFALPGHVSFVEQYCD
jgi:hypothetical protein